MYNLVFKCYMYVNIFKTYYGNHLSIIYYGENKLSVTAVVNNNLIEAAHIGFMEFFAE